MLVSYKSTKSFTVHTVYIHPTYLFVYPLFNFSQTHRHNPKQAMVPVTTNACLKHTYSHMQTVKINHTDTHTHTVKISHAHTHTQRSALSPTTALPRWRWMSRRWMRRWRSVWWWWRYRKQCVGWCKSLYCCCCCSPVHAPHKLHKTTCIPVQHQNI